MPHLPSSRTIALSGALLLAACGGAPAQLVTVEQLVAQCDALKGKPVRVTGYLGECSGYECHLFASKAGMEAWDKAVLSPREGANPPPAVGIGSDEGFDRKAAPLRNSMVVISGTVARDTCTGAGGTDRSFGVDPTDIQPWSPTKSN